MTGTMNANELHELVKGWPKEAWPKGAMFAGHHLWVDTQGLGPDHAALLFEASGMRWLESWHPAPEASVTTYVSMWENIETDHPVASQWCCEVSPEHGESYERIGLTKLAAISAAILATKGAADGK